MLIILGVLAACAFGGLIYLFLSKKSTRIQKLASLGALILSGLVLGVCGVILVVSVSGKTEDPFAFPLDAVEVQQEPAKFPMGVIAFLLVFLALFAFIIYIGIRDRNKRKNTSAGQDKSNFSTDSFDV